MDNYLLFLTFVVVAVLSPGPAIFIAIKNSISHGFSMAIIGILGNITGLLFMATISSLGLGALILASSSLFYAIKIIGGIYLIYLGFKLLRSSSKPMQQIDNIQHTITAKTIYKESLFVALTNPKAIAFCTALFPQFIQINSPFLPQFTLLTVTFLAGSFIALSMYAYLANKMQKYFRKKETMSYFNKITGGIFIGIGGYIALS